VFHILPHLNFASLARLLASVRLTGILAFHLMVRFSDAAMQLTEWTIPPSQMGFWLE